MARDTSLKWAMQVKDIPECSGFSHTGSRQLRDPTTLECDMEERLLDQCIQT